MKVPAADARRVETPNAVMTTLASPTLGDAVDLVVWRVAMQPGAAGPEHTADREQVWTLLSGEATVLLADERHDLRAGDTVVLPAGVRRQVLAPAAFEALVATSAGVHVTAEGHDGVTPPWAA